LDEEAQPDDKDRRSQVGLLQHLSKAPPTLPAEALSNGRDFRVDVAIRVGPGQGETRFAISALEDEPSSRLGQAQERGEKQDRRECCESEHEAPINTGAQTAEGKGEEIAKNDADDRGHLIRHECRSTDPCRHRFSNENRHRDQ
jgi:hypothetical protein